MSEMITFSGVETNNLKNISVKLKKNAINLLIGPSGSGKSSLAYDTIAQIGLHEYLSLFDDRLGSPTYRIKEYSNVIPTVPIQQKNNNNNIPIITPCSNKHFIFCLKLKLENISIVLDT